MRGTLLGAQRVPTQFSLCAGTCALALLELRVWSRVQCGAGVCVCVTRYWEYWQQLLGWGLLRSSEGVYLYIGTKVKLFISFYHLWSGYLPSLPTSLIPSFLSLFLNITQVSWFELGSESQKTLSEE